MDLIAPSICTNLLDLLFQAQSKNVCFKHLYLVLLESSSILVYNWITNQSAVSRVQIQVDTILFM